MRKIVAGMTCLLAFLTSRATAAGPDFSRFNDEDLPKLTSRVQEADHKDPAKIAAVRKAWQTKCGKKSEGCFLSESDFLPKQKAQAGRVLLFRGENQRFDVPAVAASVSRAMAGDPLCGLPCNYSSFSAMLQSTIKTLIGFDFDVYENTQIIYDQRSRTWDVASDPRYGAAQSYASGGLIPVDKLPSGKGNADSIARNTVMGLLVGNHVSGGGLITVDPDGTQVPIDAMISFSANPNVALQFAGNSGRMLVLSVPQNKILQNADSCGNQMPAHDELIDVSYCSVWSDSYGGDEMEYDAMFFANSAYLLDSILTGN